MYVPWKTGPALDFEDCSLRKGLPEVAYAARATVD